MKRPRLLLLLASIALLCLVLLLWFVRRPERSGPVSRPTSSNITNSPAQGEPSAGADSDRRATTVYAHNLKLRKGASFRIYISWLRGQMLRTHPAQNPSFDAPDSFVFRIDKGVIHANLGDIGNYLNADTPKGFALQGINVTGEGDQVHLTGTVHKLLLPLPVELLSTVSATPEGLVHLHITKINVLKIPMKRLLGSLHIEIDDIMGKAPLPGVTVKDNDLFFDTTKLLPPPHIRGLLTAVTLTRPDLVLIYGNSPNDADRLAEWHNFLRFTGGTLDFGKLTMRDCDLTLIDASSEPWFDLDLVNYQAQLVNGYSRITPKQGLEIFMPSLDDRAPKKAIQSVTLDWLRHRHTALPSDVPRK